MSSFTPLVFSGPSGVGKSTLLKKLFKEFPDSFSFSVSHTTRPPREGEVDGKEYHFVTREQMLEEISNNSFIEYADFANKMYGTSKKAIKDVCELNKICILDVEEQGVKNIKKSEITCKYIFISPPSIEELKRRLESRGTETVDSVSRRMATVNSAMEYSKSENSYDIVIVNTDLDVAYNELKTYILGLFPKLSSTKTTDGEATKTKDVDAGGDNK